MTLVPVASHESAAEMLAAYRETRRRIEAAGRKAIADQRRESERQLLEDRVQAFREKRRLELEAEFRASQRREKEQQWRKCLTDWISQQLWLSELGVLEMDPETESHYRVTIGLKPRRHSIIAATAARYGVPLEEVIAPGRAYVTRQPRFEAQWLLWQSGASTPQIGRMFGKRDHTSVVHAIRRYQSWQQMAAIGAPAPDRHTRLDMIILPGSNARISHTTNNRKYPAPLQIRNKETDT